MSQEFETLDQPLMVEIIRRRQIPADVATSAVAAGAVPAALPASTSSHVVASGPGSTLKEDMRRSVSRRGIGRQEKKVGCCWEKKIFCLFKN